MPFTAVPAFSLELFWVLNPIPQHLTTDATPDSIQSRGLNVDLPLLVFIHAAGSNVLGWQRQLLDPRLSARYNLLLIDCPFHGFSKAEERTEHTLEDSATCVVSVLDELNLGPFALYAEGVHGCTIATWIALKRPEKVQGLLLASPGWRTEDPAVKQSLVEVEQAMFVNKGDGKDGTLPDQSLLDITHYCVGGSKRMAEERERLAKYFQARYGTGKPDWEMRFLFTFVYNREPIPADKLVTITCPVLLLRGGDDPIVCPERAVEEWQSAFTSAKNGASIHTIASAPSIISLSEGNILSRVQAQFFAGCFAKA